MIGKFLLGTALGGLVGGGAMAVAVIVSQPAEDLAASEPFLIADAGPVADAGTPESASAPVIEPEPVAPILPEVAPKTPVLPEAARETVAPLEPKPPIALETAPEVSPEVYSTPAPQTADEPPQPLQSEAPLSDPATIVAPLESGQLEPLDQPEALAAPDAPEALPTLAQAEEILAQLPPLTPEEEALLAEMAAAALVAQGLSLPEASGAEAPVEPAPETLTEIPELASTPAPVPAPLPEAPAIATEAPAAAASPLQISPLVEFAQSYENPSQKPLFSVVLIDSGEAGLDRQSFADLPLSVSFALDPSLPKAAEYAAIYRAAGREVIMLLPSQATVEDLESYAKALPQSIVIMESTRRQFQSDRGKSEAFVPVIADQGRGLLTWESQTNLADQLAKREGLPSAVIFRPLDSDKEAAPVIRRYLDRAAFKADHDGAVVVLGHTYPETLKALIEWSIEGRSANVSLAPLSAVLSSEIKAKP